MANVTWLVSVEILDALGVTAPHNLYIQTADTQSPANMNTWAADYLAKLDAITDGQITSAKASLVMTLPSGIKTAPVVGSEVERTGLFNFSQSDSKYKQGIVVPAIAQSLLVNGKINLSASAVTAWTGVITAVTQGVTVVAKFINALQALLDALISFRKHRRAENRRSFEVGA